MTTEHPLWPYLTERIMAKNQIRILRPELETQPITSEMLADFPTAYAGHKSIYARFKGRPDERHMAPSVAPIPTTELGRTYIRACLAAAGRRAPGWGFEEERVSLTWDAPHYYEPGPLDGRHRGHYAYVDLTSAYWTLHSTTTMDMTFIPGRMCGTGVAPYYDIDAVSADRRLRHVIPGSAQMSSTSWYTYGQLKVSNQLGGLAAPGLHGYVMYTMHCIAREVIDHFGAVMVLTDAYVVPEDRADLLIEFLRERWCIGAKIKGRGESALYGRDRYQVGDHKSRNAPAQWTSAPTVTYKNEGGRQTTEPIDSNPVDTIMEVDTSWLHKRRTRILKRQLPMTGLHLQ